jgi:hypothetical protein
LSCLSCKSNAQKNRLVNKYKKKTREHQSKNLFGISCYEIRGRIYQTLLSVDPKPMFNRLRSVLSSKVSTVLPMVGYREGGLGGYGPFKGGMKGGGSALFRRKGRGGTPFFSQENENIDILGNFGHFVA